MTKILYYITSNGDNPVKKFIDSLENIQKAKVFRIFQTIQLYGLEAVMPHIKKLTGLPFWEIRILGKDNIRMIYLLIDADYICILHGFVKKTKKTSEKDINTAMNRCQEWQNRKKIIH